MPTKTKSTASGPKKTGASHSRSSKKLNAVEKTPASKPQPAKAKAQATKAPAAKSQPTKVQTTKVHPRKAVKPQRDDLDLDYFRELLLEERARLEEERETIRASNKDLEGSMPGENEGGEEDTADLASAIMDKEMDLSVEEEIEDRLAAIDHALHKMEDGTYGICDMSGEPIRESRLKMIPWASLTRQCQELAEGD